MSRVCLRLSSVATRASAAPAQAIDIPDCWVFVSARDVTLREPSQDDGGRSLPRVTEVVRAALAANRRREHGPNVTVVSM